MRIQPNFADKAAVDLDLLGAEAVKLLQIGVTTAKIVQGDAHPQRLERIQGAADGRRPGLRQRGFGNFQLQHGRWHLVAMQQGGDIIRQIGLAQLPAGQIYRYRRHRQAGLTPALPLRQRGVQQAMAQGND